MKNDDVCEIECINEKAVKEVKSNMLDETILLDVADNFKIFSDYKIKNLASFIPKRIMCMRSICSA